MTCIAVRNGVMAADSQVTHQSLRTAGEKLFQVGDDLVGICGDLTAALVFVDWYADRESRRPDLTQENEFEALVLTGEGLTYWTANLRPQTIRQEFYAIGSGSHLAIGAMARGASAKQAVLIACDWCPNCSAPVVTARLK